MRAFLPGGVVVGQRPVLAPVLAPVLVLALALVVGLAGCGPSGAQVKTAKAAQYSAPTDQLLDIALQVTQQKYKIGAVEPDRLRFATMPQFYTAEGGRISPTSEFGGDYVSASGGDVELRMIVELRQVDAGRVVVAITPRTFQLITGSPKPRELLPDDPNLPPWVLGRVNALAVAIYENARPYVAPATP